MQADPSPTLSSRWALVIRGLQATLAAHMVKAGSTHALLMLVWKRIGQLNSRIDTLNRRLAAGRRVAPRPRTHPRPGPGPGPDPRPLAQPTATPRRPTGLRLPCKPGWLVRQAIQTGVYGTYFRQLLEDPQMAALLQAAPQLKRQLRPILRLLMLELPPALALPPRPPRAPRPRPPRPERPKKPRRAPCHGAFRPKEYWRPGPIRPIWTA